MTLKKVNRKVNRLRNNGRGPNAGRKSRGYHKNPGGKKRVKSVVSAAQTNGSEAMMDKSVQPWPTHHDDLIRRLNETETPATKPSQPKVREEEVIEVFSQSESRGYSAPSPGIVISTKKAEQAMKRSAANWYRIRANGGQLPSVW